MAHHVFFSYSHQDIALMERVSADLQSGGISVWSDTRLTAGNESWRKSIEQAIDAAQCVVVIFSPAAKESKWVTAELDYATAQNKAIYPILASGDQHNAVPFGFATAQWVDMRLSDHYTREFSKLLEAIARQASGSPPPTLMHSTPHSTPSLTVKKLNAWNLLDQYRLMTWLFINPSELFVYRAAYPNDESIPKTAGWVISILCWLPTLLLVLGYTLSSIQVNPAPNPIFLPPAYALIFLGWFCCGWMAGRSDAFSSIAALIFSISLYFLTLIIIGGVGQLVLINIHPILTIFVLITGCISTAIAAGMGVNLANAGTGVAAGNIIGSVLFIAAFKTPIGIAGGIAGMVLILTTFAAAFSLDKSLKHGQALWLLRGLLALLVIDYLVMFWVYLLGGWYVITNL